MEEQPVSRKRQKPGVRWGFILVLFLCVGVAAFSTFKILDQLITDKKGTDAYGQIAGQAKSEDTKTVTVQKPVRPAQSDGGAALETEAEPETETVEIQTIDFKVLREQCADVIAWIELPGTILNYPVVQADDNDYYLRRLMDGSHHRFGTLFADYRNNPGFSDTNTIIYGHHIKAGDMFCILEEYKQQAFFDEHPYLFLYLPGSTWQLQLFAAVVSEAADPPQLTFWDDEEFDSYFRHIRDESTFESDVEIHRSDRIVTLYTCTYDFDDARFYVFGKLVPLTEQ